MQGIQAGPPGRRLFHHRDPLTYTHTHTHTHTHLPAPVLMTDEATTRSGVVASSSPSHALAQEVIIVFVGGSGLGEKMGWKIFF